MEPRMSRSHSAITAAFSTSIRARWMAVSSKMDLGKKRVQRSFGLHPFLHLKRSVRSVGGTADARPYHDDPAMSVERARVELRGDLRRASVNLHGGDLIGCDVVVYFHIIRDSEWNTVHEELHRTAA